MRHFDSDSLDWLRYHHYLRPPADKPQTPVRSLITDFMGYNFYETQNPTFKHGPGENWVGDLMLECEVTVDDDFAKLPDDGIIAWQLHAGAHMEVTFKNVQFKDLSNK